MSEEFDDFVTVIHAISNEIEDARLFSIAERHAIQLMMDSINRLNDKILRKGEPK
jgi:hypothetical protein